MFRLDAKVIVFSCVGLAIFLLGAGMGMMYEHRNQNKYFGQYFVGYRRGVLVHHYRDIIERYEAPSIVPLGPIKGCPIFSLDGLLEKFFAGCGTLQVSRAEDIEGAVYLLSRLKIAVVAAQLQISEALFLANCIHEGDENCTALFVRLTRPLSRPDLLADDPSNRSFIFDNQLEEGVRLVLRVVR